MLYGEEERRREQELALGTRVSGEEALPVSRGQVLRLSQERLCRHMLVCGATGSGKTETLLRLAWTVARSGGARVFYLDGKGDREAARRFVGLMAQAGRQARVFPMQAVDGWRGEGHEIAGRLMEIIDYAKEGPAAWYRDVAKAVVALVCEHPQGPPRSSREALGRMEAEALENAHPGSGTVAALNEQAVREVRLRYEAFFGATRGALDGEWSWEDADAGYLLLDSLALREETASLARFLLEDFALWFSRRKPLREPCVLVVDEFAALAGTMGMAAKVEQARGFHTALILAPQVVAGIGDESERARILGSVETVVCHRVNTPEEIVELAGTRRVPEHVTRYSREGSTGEGTTRQREDRKIDANDVRALAPGDAFVIRHGRAMRVRIAPAPALSGALPGEGSVLREAPDERARGEAPPPLAAPVQDVAGEERGTLGF